MPRGGRRAPLVGAVPFDLLHVRYNAAHRGAETEVFACLSGSGRPGLVSYTAARWGHLLAARRMPSGQAPLSATDCYRFVMSHPAVDICLCGPRNIDQMQTALSALGRGPLDEGEMMMVRGIGDHVRRSGGGFF